MKRSKNVKYKDSKWRDCSEFSWCVKTALDLIEISLKWPSAIPEAAARHVMLAMGGPSHPQKGPWHQQHLKRPSDCSCVSMLGHSLPLQTAWELDFRFSLGLGNGPSHTLCQISQCSLHIPWTTLTLSCPALPLGRDLDNQGGRAYSFFVFWESDPQFSPF